MFNNRINFRSYVASAALFVTVALAFNLGASQAQDNPTNTPLATSAATGLSLNDMSPTPTTTPLPGGGLGALLSGGGLPGPNRLGIDFGKPVLDAVTQATNLTEAQLVQEVTSGKSLSDVITANNGDPQAVEATAKASITDQINNAVKSGTLTQNRATRLISSLDVLLNSVFNFTVPSLANRMTRLIQGLEVRELVRETAVETNLNGQEIVNALTGGQTLSQIAQDNNIDPSAIVNAVTQTITDQINNQVKLGRLTQSQADTLVTNLNKTLTDLMNQSNPLLPTGGSGGFGGGRPPVPSNTPVGSSA